MAIQLQPEEKDTRRIVQAVRELVEGRHNAGGDVTLVPNSATTAVSHPNCSRDSKPNYSPRSASASAEVGNGTIWISSIDQGGFILTHANNPIADRLFCYTVTGG